MVSSSKEGGCPPTIIINIENLKKTFFQSQSNVDEYWDLLYELDKMPDPIKPDLGKFIMGKLNEWFKLNNSTLQYVEDSQVKNKENITSFKPRKEVEEKEEDLRNKSTPTLTVANLGSLHGILIESMSPNGLYEIDTSEHVIKLKTFTNLPAYLLIANEECSGSLLDAPVFDNTPVLVPTTF